MSEPATTAIGKRRLLRQAFERFFGAFRLRTAGKWIIYGILIGVLSGLVACAFFYVLQWAEFQTF